MKKYSEIKSKEPFDWFKALSKNCKDMSPPEIQSLEKKAFSWVTCACGNQCAVIPREKDGQPVDKKLALLGGAFYDDGIGQMENSMMEYFNIIEMGKINSDLPVAPEDSFSIDYDEREKKKHLKDANKYRLKAISILKNVEKRSQQLILSEVTRSKDVLKQLGYTVKK